MNNLLEVKKLKKSFYTINGEIEAIKDVSFNVNKGDFIAIVGTSGCGKSTLLSILAGLEKESGGQIISNIFNPVIGYMLQEDSLFPYYTVLENVLLGNKILGIYNDEDKEYAINLLNRYNLGSFINKYPNELSGGMKQRVALIRTLSIKPDLLFLDEPFSALDYTTRLDVADDVYSIIKDLNITTIMVTHDINEAISMANKVIVLSKSPSVVKSIYNINLNKRKLPSLNRKDINFNNFYDSIRKDLESNE